MATTVILGSGIIGSTLHQRSFASASGRAGGFLAKDWFSPSLASLGELSFSEHKRLAEDNGGREKWGYLRSTSVSYVPEAKRGRNGNNKGAGEVKGEEERGDEWLREGSSRAAAVSEVVGGRGEDEPTWLRRMEGDEVEVISDEGSTAQLKSDPLRLCQFLLNTCLDRGVQLHHPAKALSIDKDMRDELSSICILNTSTDAITVIPHTKILIAAGAWSPQVFATLFPNSSLKLPISSLAGHSLVVRSPRWGSKHEQEAKGCYAVFTTDTAGYSPEIFSRMGEEIYIAGLNSSSIPLPTLATDSIVDSTSIDNLKKTARRLLGNKLDAEDLEIVREGLCFRPVAKKGVPIIVRIPDEKLGAGMKTRGGVEGGMFLAAGHGPWGISNSLGTGKVMAEMMMGMKTSVDISGLGLYVCWKSTTLKLV